MPLPGTCGNVRMTLSVLLSLTLALLLAQKTNAQLIVDLDHDTEAEAYWNQVNSEVPTSRLTVSLQSERLQEDCSQNPELTTHRLTNLFYRILQHTVLRQALVSVKCVQTVAQQTGSHQIVEVGLNAIAYLNYDGSLSPSDARNLQSLLEACMNQLQIQYCVIDTQTPVQFSWFGRLDHDIQASSFWQSVIHNVPTTTVTMALSHDCFGGDCTTLNGYVRAMIFHALRNSNIQQALVDAKCTHTIPTEGRTWHFVRVKFNADSFHNLARSSSAAVEQNLKEAMRSYLTRQNFAFSLLGVHEATKTGWYRLNLEFPWIEDCNDAMRPIHHVMLNASVNFQDHFRSELDGLRLRLTQITESSENVGEITVLSIKLYGAEPRVVIAANIRFPPITPEELEKRLSMAARDEHTSCQAPVKLPIIMNVIRGKWQPDSRHLLAD